MFNIDLGWISGLGPSRCGEFHGMAGMFLMCVPAVVLSLASQYVMYGRVSQLECRYPPQPVLQHVLGSIDAIFTVAIIDIPQWGSIKTQPSDSQCFGG